MHLVKGMQSLDLAVRTLALATLILWMGVAPQSRQVANELEEAREAREAGDFLQASALLESAANRLPWNASLWEEAGRLALQGSDVQKAIPHLERAGALAGLSLQGQVDLAQAYRRAGDLPAAIRLWEAVRENPNAPHEITYQLYLARRSLGNFPAALEALIALLVAQPSEARLHYQAGLLLAAQDPESALPRLAQAAKLDAAYLPPARELSSAIRSAAPSGERAYTLVAAGRALASLQEWDLATEAFRQASLERPDYSEAWAFLGEARQHLQEDLAARGVQSPAAAGELAALQKAIQLDPNSLAANTFLGLYWRRQARYELALNYLRKAVNLDPNNPALRAELANALALDGRLPAAMDMHRLALELSAGDPLYQKSLVNFCLTYQYALEEAALPLAGELLAVSPKDAEAVDLLGQVLASLGDIYQAELFFQRALQLDEAYSPARLHLGLIYLQQGKNSLAYESFSLASAQAPGTPTAEQAQRLLQAYFP